MPTDNHGLDITAANDEAVQAYEATLAGYLGLRRDTGAHLKAALAADPDLVMGHCIKGCFMQLFANRILVPRARSALEAARAAAETRGANGRETRHIEALAAWVDEDMERALAAWEAILAEHPRDALALRLAHHFHFYLAPGEAMRASLARVLDAWDASAPNHGFVLGMAAFAHEESGLYDAAERLGRQAVERNAQDTWAVHAVAHVMEMQGRHAEGIDWLTSLEPHWTTAHNFRFHVWWHRALFHLERGETDAVLALYDAHIRGEEPDSDDYLDLSNGVALLWRLEALGVEVGGRWAELADKSAGRAEDLQLAFADAHYLMALAAAGRRDEAAALLAGMEAFAATGATEAVVARTVGLPLGRAIVAYHAGDHAAAAEALAPVADEVWRIGGSNAQRDLFAQLLIQAELKAGRYEAAGARLAARTEARPASAASWRWYAAALDGAGDARAAAAAREQAEAA